MCGIIGVISKKSLKVSSIKKMNDAIAHRGPDSEGFFFAGDVINDIHLEKIVTATSENLNVAFGHKRLSIIDLSKQGHQPMHYMDRYWITYNGEIYNYIELKEELEKLRSNPNIVKKYIGKSKSVVQKNTWHDRTNLFLAKFKECI